MAVAFKKGAKVRQKVFVIEGEVTGIQVIDDDVHFSVAYTGEDGEMHERVFMENEIEKIEDAE